jgi:uncharacterized membrane protein
MAVRLMRSSPVLYQLLAVSLVALTSLPVALGLEDGRIGILYVGCIARSQPFWNMRQDPMFSLSFVQATMRDWAAWGPTQQASQGNEVQRLVRLYMPRTYNRLVERFDAIVLSNANCFAVGPKNIEMLAQGVREGGLGLFMSGGWESFGGSFGRPSWGETSIGALLPTKVVEDTWIQYPSNYLIMVPVDSGNELASSLPWDEKAPCMSDFHHNLVKLKDGAELLAKVRSAAFDNHPAMATWELENGVRTLALTGEIHRFCERGSGWEYGFDFGSNAIIYVDGRPVPQDIGLVHSVRSMIFSMATRRALLLSLLDFCDSFGANTDRMMDRVDDVEAAMASANPKYLDLRFAEVLEDYQEIEKMYDELERESLKLKDRTLMWVYVIEWLAVTGTAMVSGVVLWSVMVHRRLYREVGTTKLSGTEVEREGS